jgi:endo-alpha-N-acetylgalactosaminidase
MVEDAEGNMGRVFIDGYITTAKDVENLQVGCEITVTGLASYDNSFDGVAPRIRIRNRADVVCGDVPAAPVDKTELENAINEAKELNGEDYTEESYNALLSALADAEAAYAKGDATQEEVDAAAAALKAAIAALEKIPAETDPTDPTEPEETVDKSALEEAIEELFKLNPDDYTEETVQAASKALIEAEAVLANENATQAEVDAAAAALKAAIAALEPKVTEPEDTDPTEPEETEPEETTKPSTGDNVQTGDEFNPIIWVVIMLVALAGVVVLFLLRKKMDK